MTRPNVSRAAPLFAALGDETRLRLLARLGRAGPQSITRLSAGMPVTRQAVTKHLRALEAAGLARARRHGRERVWTLEPARLDDAQRYLGMISAQWDSAIDRLRTYVEE